MKGIKFLGWAVLVFVFTLSGCVARTYEITRDRVDQDVESGNRGYLQGKAPQQEAPRKATREVRVFEFELGSSYKNKAAKPRTEEIITETDIARTPVMREPQTQTVTAQETEGAMQQYTVGKGDTLQKISQKFYGTTKKWQKIYQANRGALKGPDKIYPGQVINVPQEVNSGAVSSDLPGESTEGLK
ncbi:MAG: LysM peptidoglycan-binding domain-containing protein [Candidatus Omnitrophota bacterium]